MIGKQTKKWLKFRKEYLSTRKNWYGAWDCERCMKVTYYPDLDHIKKRSTHPELKYDESNIQILCRPCHIQVTAGKQ